MRLIVLTGLVVVEKLQMAVDLAWQNAAEPLLVIDQVSRLSLDCTRLPEQARCVRLEGDLLPLLREAHEPLVILAASESLAPDALFMLLDEARNALPALSVQTIALVDTRTCDCFPTLREMLEAYADRTIYLPLDQDMEVLRGWV